MAIHWCVMCSPDCASGWKKMIRWTANGGGERFAAKSGAKIRAIIEQMKTSEFISALRAAPGNQLLFVDVHAHAVHSGYHLTELKAASFETVDCGGRTNRWQETIVQLWVPSDPDDEYMPVAKFMRIFD